MGLLPIKFKAYLFEFTPFSYGAVSFLHLPCSSLKYILAAQGSQALCPTFHMGLSLGHFIQSVLLTANGFYGLHLVTLCLEVKANISYLYSCAVIFPYIQLGTPRLEMGMLRLRSTEPVALSSRNYLGPFLHYPFIIPSMRVTYCSSLANSFFSSSNLTQSG